MTTIFDDIRRQKRIRAAEGLLDLIMVFADRWMPEPINSDRVALRALEVLKPFEATDRHYGHVQYLRGQCFRALGKYAEATEPLEDAASDDPGNIHIQLALGWCYKRVGRIDQAIRALENAAEHAPYEGIVHYNLACYWALCQNTEMAVRYLLQSFDLDPEYREFVSGESDFDPIRNDPGFQSVTGVIV